MSINRFTDRNMRIRFATFVANPVQKRFAMPARIVSEQMLSIARNMKKNQIREVENRLRRLEDQTPERDASMHVQPAREGLRFENLLHVTDFQSDAETALPYVLSVAEA